MSAPKEAMNPDPGKNAEVDVIADQTMNPNVAAAKEITSAPNHVNAGGEVIAGQCREPNEEDAKQPNSAHMDVVSQQGASVPSPADTINAYGGVKKDTCAGPTHMGSPHNIPGLDATHRQDSACEWYGTSANVPLEYRRPEYIRKDIYDDMIDRRNAYMTNNGVTERPDPVDGILSEY